MHQEWEHTRIVHAVACVLIAGLSAAASQSQTAHLQASTLPPGVISGAEHPEMVSDESAMKAFLLAMAEPSSADPEKMARLKAKLKAVGLGQRDNDELVSHVHGFADAWKSYAEMARQLSKRINETADARAMNDRTALVGKMDLLVSTTFEGMIARLSPAGADRLKAHLQTVKKRMYVIPPPDMSRAAQAAHH
jgi:hypothetical protein